MQIFQNHAKYCQSFELTDLTFKFYLFPVICFHGGSALTFKSPALSFTASLP
uniref:Uncharacterized protein n=1 Tax=Anguilla anguilla TaxID=7936 RepID=A0A0E9SQN2_ANGAN